MQREATGVRGGEMPNAKRFGQLQPHDDFQSQPNPPTDRLEAVVVWLRRFPQFESSRIKSLREFLALTIAVKV
jgi:hypothetical protein